MSEIQGNEIADQCEALMKRIKADWDAKSPEEKIKIEAERRQSEQRQIDSEIARIMTSGHAPERQKRAGDIDRAGAWGETEARLKSKLGKGFIIAIIGIRGNGKTQMSVEMMRQMAIDRRTSRYCTAMEFFMQIKATYKKDSEQSENEIVQEFSQVPLLIIDEIGQRSENDWENRLLYEVINRRYNALRDTLIISNQEIADLEAALGPSIISRMRETGGIIECTWGSYRK